MEVPDYQHARKRKTIDEDNSDWEVEPQMMKTNAKTLKNGGIAILGHNQYSSKQYSKHMLAFEEDEHEKLSAMKSSPKKKKAKNVGDCEEKRARRFRTKAPQSYQEIKGRALTQRFYVLDRKRCGSEEVPEEHVTMSGTTGNVYEQQIGKVPSCTCPHARKGNQCKHLIYLMLRVYKVREAIGYQLALTSSELREVFHNAPIPSADVEPEDVNDPSRKPIEGECPICYMEFEPEHEKISYCKAACGNNVHTDCMNHWAQAKSGKTTCPYCRATWADDELSTSASIDLLNGATKSRDGYINIASKLGISSRRDYSTYHTYWVNRQRRAGLIDDEADYADD